MLVGCWIVGACCRVACLFASLLVDFLLSSGPSETSTAHFYCADLLRNSIAQMLHSTAQIYRPTAPEASGGVVEGGGGWSFCPGIATPL